MRVSVSRVKLFKACRRAYELKYIENLVPIKKADALVIGSDYHQKLEDLYNKGEFDDTQDKATAMAIAYQKYIYPLFQVQEAEKDFTYDLGDGDELVGRIDAIAKDGSIVEHKTTGATNLEEYEYTLMWDEQLLAYMLVTGVRKVYYTIVRKPNIRLKQNETEEEFYQRMVEWYDVDTEQKIKMVELTRTDDEVQEYLEGLKGMLDEMKAGKIYRNTCNCDRMGSRCEYSQICLEKKLAESYVDYERREEYAVEEN